MVLSFRAILNSCEAAVFQPHWVIHATVNSVSSCRSTLKYLWLPGFSQLLILCKIWTDIAPSLLCANLIKCRVKTNKQKTLSKKQPKTQLWHKALVNMQSSCFCTETCEIWDTLWDMCQMWLVTKLLLLTITSSAVCKSTHLFYWSETPDVHTRETKTRQCHICFKWLQNLLFFFPPPWSTFLDICWFFSQHPVRETIRCVRFCVRKWSAGCKVRG